MTDRLPADTSVGDVHLQISNLDRSLGFYQDLLGLRLVDRSDGDAFLSASGHAPHLLRLSERADATPRPRRATGLFHVAFRAPDRAALGRWLHRLMTQGVVLQGASDHAVSEAVYLADPDGLGIELYCDRPRSSWPMRGEYVAMVSEPFDTAGVLAAADDEPWDGVDPATDIGHVHLCVSSLETAERFYVETLGFSATQRDFPGALFLAAGGYHHHLGTNTWSSSGAGAAPDTAVGLRSYGLYVPGGLDMLRARLPDTQTDEEGLLVHDGDGIAIHLRST